jgi:uncharacterized lipoprotein YmbA
MKIHFMRRKITIVCGCVVLFLSGCLSFDSKKDQSVFFVLKPLIESESVLAKGHEDVKCDGLGMRNIRLPEYLDRPQVVWFSEDGMVDFSENFLWGESIQEGTRRVLLENFRKGLGTPNVQIVPWQEGFHPKYELLLDIVEWRALVDKDIKLVAYWQIVKNEPVTRSEFVADREDEAKAEADMHETKTVVILSTKTEITTQVKDWDNVTEIAQGMSESLKVLTANILQEFLKDTFL